MSERTEAINNAYDQNQNGRTSFYYVQTQVLERLGITAFKSQVNDNFIRVMPPKDPRAFWAREVYIHSNIGANRATFLCMNRMFGKPCPVCEHVDQLRAGNVDPETLKPLYAKKRYLMFVYDVRDDSTIAKGLRWYDAPPKLVSEIIIKSKDKRTKAVVDVCDPVEGRDIEFVRKGQSIKTEYVGIDLKTTEPVPADWYENVPTFDDVLVIPTYEQVKHELTGGVTSNTTTNENRSNQPAETTTGERVNFEEHDDPGSVESTQEPKTEPSSRSGPTPRGATTRSQNQQSAPPAATADVRAKIEEIKRRRAQGQS